MQNPRGAIDKGMGRDGCERAAHALGGISKGTGYYLIILDR